jgi:enoyl-CoA hydratase/carnithine racemase
MIEERSGVFILSFDNRSFNISLYEHVAETLNKLNVDDNCKAVILTGGTKVFSAGHDISVQMTDETPITKMMDSVMNFSKPLIAAVNGPAIGIGCTILGWCDIVYSVKTAIFEMPFRRIGIIPEFGCRNTMLGRSNLNEMLYLGKRQSAQVMYERGFVSRLFDTYDEMLGDILGNLEDVSTREMQVYKKLMQHPDRTRLWTKAVKQETDIVRGIVYDNLSFDDIMSKL